MVEITLDTRGGAGGNCGSSTQGDAVAGRGCDRDRRLTKETLEAILAEDNPHEQFRLFASCLWSSGSASMSTPVRIMAEYDYHNIIFCREQNFTTEQTIAFRGIALGVFEATIVRGELDLDGAFEAFTERVLALAEVPETTARGGGGGGKSSSGTSNAASEINNTAGNSSSSALHSAEGIAGVNSMEIGSSSTAVPGTSLSSGGEEVSRGAAGENEGRGGPVFSVGDVDAITRFVSRGLYRNFKLYRMCFEQDARVCRENRQVQVETPLEQPPLHEAEPA